MAHAGPSVTEATSPTIDLPDDRLNPDIEPASESPYPDSDDGDELSDLDDDRDESPHDPSNWENDILRSTVVTLRKESIRVREREYSLKRDLTQSMTELEAARLDYEAQAKQIEDLQRENSSLQTKIEKMEIQPSPSPATTPEAKRRPSQSRPPPSGAPPPPPPGAEERRLSRDLSGAILLGPPGSSRSTPPRRNSRRRRSVPVLPSLSSIKNTLIGPSSDVSASAGTSPIPPDSRGDTPPSSRRFLNFGAPAAQRLPSPSPGYRTIEDELKDLRMKNLRLAAQSDKWQDRVRQLETDVTSKNNRINDLSRELVEARNEHDPSSLVSDDVMDKLEELDELREELDGLKERLVEKDRLIEEMKVTMESTPTAPPTTSLPLWDADGALHRRQETPGGYTSMDSRPPLWFDGGEEQMDAIDGYNAAMYAVRVASDNEQIVTLGRRLSAKLLQRPMWNDLYARGILMNDPNVSPSMAEAFRTLKIRKASARLEDTLMNRPDVDELHSRNIYHHEGALTPSQHAQNARIGEKVYQRSDWHDLQARGILYHDPQMSQSLAERQRELELRRAGAAVENTLQRRSTQDELERRNIFVQGNPADRVRELGRRLSEKMDQRPQWQELQARGILYDSPTKSASLQHAHRSMMNRQASRKVGEMLTTRPSVTDLAEKNIIRRENTAVSNSAMHPALQELFVDPHASAVTTTGPVYDLPTPHERPRLINTEANGPIPASAPQLLRQTRIDWHLRQRPSIDETIARGILYHDPRVVGPSLGNMQRQLSKHQASKKVGTFLGRRPTKEDLYSKNIMFTGYDPFDRTSQATTSVSPLTPGMDHDHHFPSPQDLTRHISVDSRGGSRPGHVRNLSEKMESRLSNRPTFDDILEKGITFMYFQDEHGPTSSGHPQINAFHVGDFDPSDIIPVGNQTAYRSRVGDGQSVYQLFFDDSTDDRGRRNRRQSQIISTDIEDLNIEQYRGNALKNKSVQGRLSMKIEQRPTVGDLYSRGIVVTKDELHVANPRFISAKQELHRRTASLKIGNMLKERPSADELMKKGIYYTEEQAATRRDSKAQAARRVSVTLSTRPGLGEDEDLDRILKSGYIDESGFHFTDLGADSATHHVSESQMSHTFEKMRIQDSMQSPTTPATVYESPDLSPQSHPNPYAALGSIGMSHNHEEDREEFIQDLHDQIAELEDVVQHTKLMMNALRTRKNDEVKQLTVRVQELEREQAFQTLMRHGSVTREHAIETSRIADLETDVERQKDRISERDEHIRRLEFHMAERGIIVPSRSELKKQVRARLTRHLFQRPSAKELEGKNILWNSLDMHPTLQKSHRTIHRKRISLMVDSAIKNRTPRDQLVNRQILFDREDDDDLDMVPSHPRQDRFRRVSRYLDAELSGLRTRKSVQFKDDHKEYVYATPTGTTQSKDDMMVGRGRGYVYGMLAKDDNGDKLIYHYDDFDDYDDHAGIGTGFVDRETMSPLSPLPDTDSATLTPRSARSSGNAKVRGKSAPPGRRKHKNKKGSKGSKGPKDMRSSHMKSKSEFSRRLSDFSSMEATFLAEIEDDMIQEHETHEVIASLQQKNMDLQRQLRLSTESDPNSTEAATRAVDLAKSQYEEEISSLRLLLDLLSISAEKLNELSVWTADYSSRIPTLKSIDLPFLLDDSTRQNRKAKKSDIEWSDGTHLFVPATPVNAAMKRYRFETIPQHVSDQDEHSFTPSYSRENRASVVVPINGVVVRQQVEFVENVLKCLVRLRVESEMEVSDEREAIHKMKQDHLKREAELNSKVSSLERRITTETSRPSFSEAYVRSLEERSAEQEEMISSLKVDLEHMRVLKERLLRNTLSEIDRMRDQIRLLNRHQRSRQNGNGNGGEIEGQEGGGEPGWTSWIFGAS